MLHYFSTMFWWIQGYGNKKLTVYAIREELYSPFKDNRTTSATLSPVDMFILLTGETPGVCVCVRASVSVYIQYLCVSVCSSTWCVITKYCINV